MCGGSVIISAGVCEEQTWESMSDLRGSHVETSESIAIEHGARWPATEDGHEHPPWCARGVNNVMDLWRRQGGSMTGNLPLVAVRKRQSNDATGGRSTDVNIPHLGQRGLTQYAALGLRTKECGKRTFTREVRKKKKSRPRGQGMDDLVRMELRLRLRVRLRAQVRWRQNDLFAFGCMRVFTFSGPRPHRQAPRQVPGQARSQQGRPLSCAGHCPRPSPKPARST